MPMMVKAVQEHRVQQITFCRSAVFSNTTRLRWCSGMGKPMLAAAAPKAAPGITATWASVSGSSGTRRMLYQMVAKDSTAPDGKRHVCFCSFHFAPVPASQPSARSISAPGFASLTRARLT